MKFFETIKNKDVSTMSVPLEKEMYGVKIKKLPNGQYIKALATVQNLPQILLENCFPNIDTDEDIVKSIMELDKDKLLIMAGKLIQVIPEQFLKIVSNLLDIPFEKLMNELSPNETLDILEAYWKMNDLSVFFEKLKGMVKQNKTVQTILQSQKK